MDLSNYRNEDGTLMGMTFPGCYPIVYYTACGDVLCPECAEVEDECNITGVDTYMEGPIIQCAECGVEIDSAYGVPE